VTRQASSEDIELHRLLKSPRPAQVDLVGQGVLSSGILPVLSSAAKNDAPASLQPDKSLRLAPEPTLGRHSMEVLLGRAEHLARSMLISDPRGRLLQIAMLRRDHALLDAVVRNIDVVYARQCRATWRPTDSRAGAPRVVSTAGSSRRKFATERPVAKNRRAR